KKLLTKTVYYSGLSTASSPVILKTVLTCYNGNTTNCASAAPNLPVTQLDVYTTIGSKTSRLLKVFDSVYGNPTDVYRYDWYSGTTYPLISHTATPAGSWNGSTCVAINTYIHDRPCYKNVYDGTGTIRSSEVFSYDAKGNVSSHTISPVANVG